MVEQFGPSIFDGHQVFDGSLAFASNGDALHSSASLPGQGLAPATSVPGLRSPLPHLYRDCARPCHICTGTALAPATSVRAGRVAAAYRMRVAFENATETSYVITELELAPVHDVHIAEVRAPSPIGTFESISSNLN